MKVKCLWDSVVIPKRSTKGATGYDINASYNCMIPANGKGIVQIRLALVLPKGVYTRIAPRSRLAMEKFIDTGTRVVDSAYWGEVSVIIFKHSSMDFLV